MSKFRIVETRGVFFPERKSLFGWRRLYGVYPPGITTISCDAGMGAFNIEDAKTMLAFWVQINTSVVHDL